MPKCLFFSLLTMSRNYAGLNLTYEFPTRVALHAACAESCQRSTETRLAGILLLYTVHCLNVLVTIEYYI